MLGTVEASCKAGKIVCVLTWPGTQVCFVLDFAPPRSVKLFLQIAQFIEVTNAVFLLVFVQTVLTAF